MSVDKNEVLQLLAALTDRPEADDEHWWKGVRACIKTINDMPDGKLPHVVLAYDKSLAGDGFTVNKVASFDWFTGLMFAGDMLRHQGAPVPKFDMEEAAELVANAIAQGFADQIPDKMLSNEDGGALITITKDCAWAFEPKKIAKRAIHAMIVSGITQTPKAG